MERTNPTIKGHINLKTYSGEDYEVYKDSILYKDLIIKIPKITHKDKSEEIEPATFELGISNYCNLACKYCFASHKENIKFKAKDHISAIKKIVKHFGKKDNYCFFLNSDGEIFTEYEEVKKVVDFCNENNYKFIIRSNGTETELFQNKDKLKKLLFDDYSISYDGEHTTERVFKNGESTGKVVRENIKSLVEIGKRVQINIVVTPNTENLYETVMDLKDIGVQKIMITQQKDKEYSDEEMSKVLDNFKDFFKKVFNDFIDKNNSIFEFLRFCNFAVPNCSGDWNHFLKIDRDLNVSKCSYIHNKIPLKDFPKKFTSIKKENFDCNDSCVYNSYCMGTFCAGLDNRLGCELRKLYFEFMFNIIIYYKENSDIEVTEKFLYNLFKN